MGAGSEHGLVDDVLFSAARVRAPVDALSEFGRPKAVRLPVLADREHWEPPTRAVGAGFCW